MKITRLRFYGGARDKVSRLGLSSLFLEVLEMLLDTQVMLAEERQANGAAHVRELVDASFRAKDGWKQRKSGGIDWKKQAQLSEAFLSRIGVEIQVSARSDLLVRDLVHLRNSIQESEIDIGVIVVPDDRMQRFLPDRTPSFGDAVRYVETEFREATTYPIVLVAIEHDGIGGALPKRKRKS